MKEKIRRKNEGENKEENKIGLLRATPTQIKCEKLVLMIAMLISLNISLPKESKQTS